MATEPAARWGQGTEGLGRLLGNTQIRDRPEKPQRSPALGSTSMDPLLGKNFFGEVTGQQPPRHTERHLSITAIELCPKASRHPTPTQTIHQASSLSSQFLF